MHGRITPRDIRKFSGLAGNIGAVAPKKWQNGGKLNPFARYSRSYAR
jgi:hypothetical protein